MSATLKRCPFCGGEAACRAYGTEMDFKTDELFRVLSVYCTECSASISVGKKDVPSARIEDLIQQWNSQSRVENLVDLVIQMAARLRAVDTGSRLASEAVDYLKRAGHISPSDTLR